MTPSPTLRRLLTALFALCVLAACGADGVRGESPFAQVTGWRLANQGLELDLRLRNVNDEALEMTTLNLSVRLGEGVPLFTIAGPRTLDIPPGGFETLHLTPATDADGLALLRALAAGETASLAYRLDGTVSTRESGDLPIEREGFIYPVPGRPGEFR